MIPCGPAAVGGVAWQTEHFPRVPADPCSLTFCRLSFAWMVGNIACGLPWQAEQKSPPWPVDWRNSFPGSSANVLPWHLPHFGSSSHGRRPARIVAASVSSVP